MGELIAEPWPWYVAGPLIPHLIGNGMSVYILVLVSALAGTWLYGVLRPSLPH